MNAEIRAQLARPFDVIIVGAGINGSGIARDAAMRGLRVLLLDKSDVAAGTTSWSSRLIHGGLRYLEHAEIGLVRESLRERERLLRIAPHLVRPIPMTLPIYDYSTRGPWMIRAGMIAYDALSFDKSLPVHHMASRAQVLARLPGLNPDGLRAAARYYDAQAEFPERLAVENTLDALAHGAVLVTGARVERLIVEGGVVRGVSFRDQDDEARYEARGTVTVNVTGSWLDIVLHESGVEPLDRRLVGGTKGSHIIVKPFPGAPPDALYIEAKSDRRPYFIIPWNELYLIGTTDVRYDGDLNQIVPSEEEIAYLLRETNIAIPECGLTRDDVLYAYAGVRPLPYHPAGETGAITRRHIIHDHAPRTEGLLSIVGGKLTTFRNLAEEAVDAVYAKLDRPAPPCKTAVIPLPGGVTPWEVFRWQFLANRPLWLGVPSANYLLRVYGSRARDVVALGNTHESLQRVVSVNGAIGATIVFAVQAEHARTLADAILRRSMIGYGEDAGLDAVREIEPLLREHLGWNETRIAEETEGYCTYVRRYRPKLLHTSAVDEAVGSPAS